MTKLATIIVQIEVTDEVDLDNVVSELFCHFDDVANGYENAKVLGLRCNGPMADTLATKLAWEE